jgi:uncharacterized membrane protein
MHVLPVAFRKKMFAPYIDPVSDKRRKILSLHIHPVMVHFPQAFAFTLLIGAIFAWVAPLSISDALYSAITIISFFLPAVVLLSIFTGLFDGKIRFRKVTTPFLKIKILLGLVFLIASIAMALLAYAGRISVSPTYSYYMLLSIITFGCSAALGFVGGKLMEAKFPG